MTDLNRIKAVRAALQVALKVVGTEHDYSIDLGRISYGTNEFTAKITAHTTVDKSGKTIDPEEEQFKLHASNMGISADLYGKTFYQDGQRYRLIGINPKAPKYPYIGQQTTTKKRYKFNAEIIGLIKQSEETANSKNAANG